MEKKLIQIANDLFGLAQRTEKEFLSFGESVFSLVNLNREHGERAEKLVRSIEDGTLMDLNVFKHLVGNVGGDRQSISEIFKDMDIRLQQLDGQIKDILGLHENLKKVCTNLDVIGLLMKIESAKLTGQSFNSVIGSLEDLGNKINRNYLDIGKHSESIHLQINELRVNLHKWLQHLLSRESTTMRGKGEDLLAEMENRQSHILESSRSIHELGSQIAPEISDMVQILQFHDISRQQMEHVSHALERVSGHVAKRSDINGDEPDHFGCYRDTKILELQISQLEHVIDESNEKAQQLSEKINNTAQIMQQQTTLSEKLEEMMGQENDGLHDVNLYFNGLMGELTEMRESASSGINSINSIIEAVNDISAVVKIVETHRRELELLTWNTIIMAYNSGSGSMGLGVLSNAIMALTDSVQSEIAENNRIVKTVLDSSTALKELLTQNLTQQLENASKDYENTDNMTDRLQDDLKRIEEVVTQTKTFEEGVEQTIGQVKFDKVVVPELEHFSEMIEDVKKSFLELLPEGYAADHADEIEIARLEQQYTMQSEREIHRSVFQTESTDSAPTSSTDNAGEFGDNIELF